MVCQASGSVTCTQDAHAHTHTHMFIFVQAGTCSLEPGIWPVEFLALWISLVWLFGDDPRRLQRLAEGRAGLRLHRGGRGGDRFEFIGSPCDARRNGDNARSRAAKEKHHGRFLLFGFSEVVLYALPPIDMEAERGSLEKGKLSSEPPPSAKRDEESPKPGARGSGPRKRTNYQSNP